MIPAAFEYSRAKSVDDALALLSQHAGSAKVIAGGQSLLPLLKLRVASAERLIDIGRLSELRGIREWDGGLAIGALTIIVDKSPSHQYPTNRNSRSDGSSFRIAPGSRALPANLCPFSRLAASVVRQLADDSLVASRGPECKEHQE